MEKSIDKEQVKKQAKEILDKFAKALEKIEKEHEIESYVNREDFERVETNKKCENNDFKKRILENAPNKDDDFIIAEKASWK